MGSTNGRAELLGNIGLFVVGCCALVITGLLVHREFFGGPGAVDSKPVTVSDWTSYTHAGQRSGSDTAVATVIEFADFQCPFCGQLEATLATLKDRHPNSVAIIYRHFPLTGIHPFARTAAIASECAALQGKFSAFHDVLFQNQAALGSQKWSAFAVSAGVRDTTAFNSCVAHEATAPRVDEDIRDGNRLKVSGTPTVMVNSLRFYQTPSLATLDSAIIDAEHRAKH